MIGQVDDPLRGAVAEWLKLLFWALRATQLYPPASEARKQHLGRAHSELSVLLSHASSLRLKVRRGRLLFNDGVVHEDDDDSGFVWALFRAGLVELTFLDGIEPWELEALLDVIRTDYSRRSVDGEDLATSLWRLHLPHVEHRDRDLLADAIAGRDVAGGEKSDDPRTDRIRTELETLTARIAVDETSGDDMVQMIDGRLETPEARHRAARTVRSYFDAAAQRCAARIPPSAAATLAKELSTNNGHQGIVSHLCVLLIDALRRNPTPRVSTPARTVLLQLFDTMLAEKRFDTAARVAGRIAKWHGIAKNDNEAEQAIDLLEALAAPEHIGMAFDGETSATDQLSNMENLLEVLGARAVPALMDTIEAIDDAKARRVVAKRIIDAQPEIGTLAAKLPRTREEVALLYLMLTKEQPMAERAELIWAALEHPAEKPRAEAIRALSTFKRGKADRVIISALGDTSALVRAAALRAIRVRGTPDAFEPVVRFIRSTSFAGSGLEQLAVESLAVTGRERAVSYLCEVAAKGSLLNAPAEEARRTAIEALGGLRTEEAIRTLQKGAATLGGRLAEACREALARREAPVWLERVDGDRFADAEALLSRQLDALDETPLADEEPPTGDLGVHAAPMQEKEKIDTKIFAVQVPVDPPAKLPTHALVEVPAELREPPPRLATSALSPLTPDRLPSSALLPALSPDVADLVLSSHNLPVLTEDETIPPEHSDEAAALMQGAGIRTSPFIPDYKPVDPKTFDDPEETEADPGLDDATQAQVETRMPALDAFDDLDDEATLGVDPDAIARVSAALRHLEEDL